MDITDFVSPIASSDWDKRKLGSNECSLDGNLDFLGNFNTKTDVTVQISNSNDGLKSGSLTSLCLLLDGHDFHDFIGEFSLALGKEFIYDLGFLDGD